MEKDVKDALDLLGKGNGKALDIGTGSGRLASGLCEYGYTVISIDENENALKRSEQNIINEGQCSNILLMKGDAHNLPFLDKTFDVVATYNAMHHMRDYKKVIDEMFRVLKSGGKILISELNERGRADVEQRHRERGQHHEAKIDINDIKSYIEEVYNCNLNIMESERTNIILCKSINI
ncbi:MAG: class I SAM-dependent methyltransferase [Thermoanaerobacteraceae bacterium]